MNTQGYFPNYFSVEDIFVTQEKVECKINTKLLQMGFLDPGAETDDLEPGKTVNLPLWYIRELKVNNSYYTVEVPSIYKNVHKAICEAEATHIELGKLHPFFYEYGRYLTPYIRNHIVGKIVFETIKQRIRHLFCISQNTHEEGKPEHKLDSIENKLYEVGIKTRTAYTNWLQMKSRNICISDFVNEHCKKRKRALLSDEEQSPQGSSKRSTI